MDIQHVFNCLTGVAIGTCIGLWLRMRTDEKLMMDLDQRLWQTEKDDNVFDTEIEGLKNLIHRFDIAGNKYHDEIDERLVAANQQIHDLRMEVLSLKQHYIFLEAELQALKYPLLQTEIPQEKSTEQAQ